MLGQTFQPSDLGMVAFLVLLEGLLSADNALVLAIMVRHLPKPLQQRALLYGLGGAFVFRLIAILIAKSILQFWWLQAVGAIYLLVLPIKHFFFSKPDSDLKVRRGAGFWQTVLYVELADIAFAIDSVLAAVATVGPQRDKIWVVYLGAVLGVVLLRFAAGFFIRLLERFPALDTVAYTLVAWVGVKLSLMAGHNFGRSFEAQNRPSPLPFTIHEMPVPVFWSVMAVIVVVGTLFAVRTSKPNAHELEEVAQIADDVEDLRVDSPEPR
jgi:YkoY family integral membrane protein